MTTAARRIWCGLRNSDQKPSRNRSSAERCGARCRERLSSRSCCFRRRLSATTAFTPPGPRCSRPRLANVLGAIAGSSLIERVEEIPSQRKPTQIPAYLRELRIRYSHLKITPQRKENDISFLKKDAKERIVL